MHSTLHRFGAPALFVLAAACASGTNGVSPSAAVSNTRIVSTEGVGVQINGSAPVANSVRTEVAVDSAMIRLRAAYEMASVPVTLFDPATGRVGNNRLMVRRALNHEALSTFVDCGHSMTSTHADQDQLTLSIVSTVRPVPGGSVVETLLTGSAADRTSGNVADLQPCSTKGVLESRLHRTAFGMR